MTVRMRRPAVITLATMSLVLGMFVLPSGRAHADLFNPRQDFLRASIGGLFLHWGERTYPQHTNCAQWEADVTNGGWSASYWVNEAVKLHEQYITLATFHSRLGYARPWPSQIPGSCSTNRDFLGELISAAAPQGIRVILYMTNDPQWWNEGLPSGQSWLDSTAFSTYAGHTVDLTTNAGFGEFSYDNFFEVMNRYPTLGGFWIDNDNQYWLDHNLYQQIYQQRPNYTISNNNEDTPIMDMISNEQKTGMTPSYDYPQAVYTAQPRLTEADFKAPTSGSWWYTGTDYTVDYLLTLGRLISNTGSSVKNLMDETPQVNGTFPSKQAAFNNYVDTWLNPIWESLHGTEGGGYMYGGLKPNFWNDGAHGVTTINKSDPNIQYIHVVTPPSTGTLRLRDNGYRVWRVTNLRTGAAVSFSQSGGTLTLTGLSGWDPYDTVFKVITNGRTGIYPSSSYTMSASASASGHGAALAADGSYLTYWDSNKTLPVNLDFDLGSSKAVQYLGINQREDSVSYARSSTETSARIADFKVYESADGVTWGSPVKTGTLPDHRGVVMIDLPAATTRHVRLEVDSTYAASTDTTRYKRLRVDEAWIGSAYATASPTPPARMRYEGETASASSGSTVDTNHYGYSGAGFLNTPNTTGVFAQWSVSSASAHTGTLTIHYANGVSTDRPMDVSVNGTVVSAAHSFTPTGNWDTWADVTLSVPLAAGTNTVRVTATTSGGAPNLDYIDVA